MNQCLFTYGSTVPLVGFNGINPSYYSVQSPSATVVLAEQQQNDSYFADNPSLVTLLPAPAAGLAFATIESPSFNPSWPVLQSPVAPDSEASYDLSLRFGGANTLSALTSDINQDFAAANPYQVQWNDRRPIAAMYIGNNSLYNSTTNPQGWATNEGIDATDGENAFASSLLNIVANQIVSMISQDDQRVITWDIEGEADIGGVNPTYIGDPSMATTIAPELAASVSTLTLSLSSTASNYYVPDAGSLANEYFDMFRNAGFEVGLTIRPEQKVVEGTAGLQVVFDTNAADMQTELINEIDYAYTNWDCTLFYIDSIGGVAGNNIAPMLAAAHAAYPNVLLIPEGASNVVDWASSSSYLQNTNDPANLQLGGSDTPSSVKAAYPNAFSVMLDYTPDTQNLPAMVQSVAQGDIIIMGFESGLNYVQDAYQYVTENDYFSGDYNLSTHNPLTGSTTYTPTLSTQNFRNDTYVLSVYTPTSLTLDPAPEYQIVRDGLVIQTGSLTGTTLSFSFQGTNDNLVIDTTNGNPIPSGGVIFNGGSTSNGDTLTIVSTSGNSVTFTAGLVTV